MTKQRKTIQECMQWFPLRIQHFEFMKESDTANHHDQWRVINEFFLDCCEIGLHDRPKQMA